MEIALDVLKNKVVMYDMEINQRRETMNGLTNPDHKTKTAELIEFIQEEKVQILDAIEVIRQNQKK